MIRERVPGIAVEHVGSTAVPGCAGKGVVDLMIPYWDGQLEPVKRTLEELGFQRQSTRNPFPEDRPMRIGSVEHEDRRFRLHVHVVPASSGEPEELRAFRNRLHTDPELLEAYVDLKRRIVEEGITDSVDYAGAKGCFIEEAWGDTRR